MLVFYGKFSFVAKNVEKSVASHGTTTASKTLTNPN